MNEKNYRHLVARLEQECALRPSQYRRKVLALALCVPAGLVALLILALAGGAGAVMAAQQEHYGLAALLAVACLGALVLLAPLLRVKTARPEGTELSRTEAPRLFAMIDKVRGKLRGPAIDSVRITTEFAIALAPSPRLGLLGWHRKTLLIGLPLLQTLSRKEFAAMLTREYTHLGGTYSKLGGWLYRQRSAWIQLAYRAEVSPAWYAAPAYRLMRRFLPYFEAYSSVLTRRTEFLADQVAASIVGPRIVADALISSHVGQRFLAQWFWPNLWARATHSPQPNYLPHAFMRKALHAAIDAEVGARWLNEALGEETASDALTPALHERLQALQQTAELPPQAAYSAAQALIAETLPVLVRHFDAQWLRTNQQAWLAQHQEAQLAQQLVDQFAKSKPTELLTQDQYRYGQALKTLGRNAEALHVLRLAADSPQGSAEAAMATATLLQGSDDEATIRYLELAIHRDASLTPKAAVTAAHFYQRRGENEKAGSYWERVAHLHAA